MKYSLIPFTVHGDSRGQLVALEEGTQYPFAVKRCYYIWATSRDAVRGKHAHRDLQQLIICMSGSCDFILDDGTTRETIHLFTPATGLYISSCIWREFTNFSPDCVVMVLASAPYDESDYIRDYDQFLKEVRA